MIAIIPLAGPDSDTAEFGLRSLYLVEGVPLISRVLASRSWVKSGFLTNENMIFVLRESENVQELKKYLLKNFDGCQIVMVSSKSRGALMSSIAGCALVKDCNVPLVVDLADLIFEDDGRILSAFESPSEQVFGVIPYFESTRPEYSYLKLRPDKVVEETAEKIVISSHASAGVYFFKNLGTYLEMSAAYMNRLESQDKKHNFFVCPGYNCLIKSGRRVLGYPVQVVSEISLDFKCRV